MALLGRRLADLEWWSGAAESCTGGWLGQVLTGQPGASRWYRGAIVAYDNQVKVSLLGVRESTIERHGAVSEAVAREMALGARAALGCDLAVSITGIAGPGGGLPGKPVGTVWVGVSSPNGDLARRHLFAGDREAVRAKAVEAGLAALIDATDGRR